MVDFTPFIVLLALYPILYASVFVHELGHAVMGRLVGFVVTSFGMGIARPWWVIRVAGMRIYFARTSPFQGLTWAYMPQLFPSRGRMIAFAAGGILANLLVTLIALGLALWSKPGGGALLWIVTAGINGLLLASTLVPFQARVGKALFRTDGALIVQALRSKTFAAPLPQVIQTVRGLRGLWTAIGDELILRANLVSAAAAWAALGAYDRAEALLAEADALSGPVPPSLRALAAVVDAENVMVRGRFEDTDRALGEAETCFRASGDAMGLLIAAIARANSRLHRGDAAGAATDLDHLVPTVRAAGRTSLDATLLLPRVATAAALSDRKVLNDCLAEYESIRRSQPSAARDLYVYRVAAGFHAANEDPGAAEPAYRQAIAAAAELTAAWLDPEERAWYMGTCSPLIEDARQCLRSLGKDEEIPPLGPRLDPKPEQPAPDRDRLFRGIGLRIMFLNGLAIAFAATLASYSHPLPLIERVFATLAMILAFFTAAGVIYLVFDRTVGRRVLPRRWSSGGVLLLLACFPWPLFLGLLLLYQTFMPGY